MKISVDKILLYIIPYLLIVSLCYNNGYWSFFSINIFQYYQVQDIIKAIGMPAFRFLGLNTIPLLLTIICVFSWKEPIATINSEGIKKKKWQQSKISKKGDIKFDTWYEKVAFGIVVLISYAVFAAGAVLSLVYLSSYSEEKSFVDGYLSSFGMESVVRILFVCFIAPVTIGGTYGAFTNNTDNGNDMRLAVILVSISLSFATAYHFGRIDAYKVITGLDFRYWLNKSYKPMKLLGKIDKFYFFSSDNTYVLPENRDSNLFDSLYYSSDVLVMSDDSVKGVNLGSYEKSTNLESGGNYFDKVYVPRKLKSH